MHIVWIEGRMVSVDVMSVCVLETLCTSTESALQSVYTIAITHTIHTPTQDDLCGMFESCARCWPMNCTSGDCQPRGLEEICEST